MMVGMVLAGTLLLSCHHREQAAPINYKLIPFATEDGLFGYMEPDGDIAIEPQYEGAQVFANGVACVCINGEYGYISEEGMVVIPAIYEQGTSFSNNLAFVRVKQDHFICIDTDGRMKFEITNCVAVRPFSEGMAPFCSVLGKW